MSKHSCTNRVEAIYHARDKAVAALEAEDYGEALRQMSNIHEFRAKVFPTATKRHQFLLEVSSMLRSICRMEDNLDLNTDIDQASE